MQFDNEDLSNTDRFKNSNKLTSTHLESGLKASGSNHRYQYMMLFSFFFLKIVTDSFYAPLPFFLIEPKIICLNEKTLKFDIKCSISEVCNTNNLFKPMKYQLLNKESSSFLSEFGIQCDSVKIGLIVSTASIGNLLSNILGPLFTDHLGRRNSILYILIFDIIVKSALFKVKDIYAVFFIITLINLNNNTVYNCASLYINEMVGSKKRGFYALFFNSLYGISGILYTLIFYYAPEWQMLHIFSIFSSIMSLVFIFSFMRESIRFYFMKNQKLEILIELEIIAKFNNRSVKFYDWVNKTLNNINSEEENNLIEKQVVNSECSAENKSTLSKIYSSSEELFNFVSFSVISLVIITGIIYNAVDVKHTDDTLFNPLIFYFTDFVILLITGCVIDNEYIGRKKPSMFFSIIATIFYFIKYMIMTYQGVSIFWIDYIVRLSVSISFNILMEWNWEIYPTDIRSTAFNLNKLFSRIGDFMTPLLMELNRPLSTIFVSSMYGFMCIFICKIRETQGQSLQEKTVSIVKKGE